ncbi:class I SAM-dependent methyltransferase [Paenibacillus sp. J5C_2022]|uniref:class I SAM-dependent methyltransferase n=1 Tax=Paenibacillus sp. J5C2022 TaxID=2977129 RepID=UPI0021D147F5|nr:class I SAM-dependent methyltransferase [Paenibacillus sp. J5C2022]MCU6707299.1 class I SAM-dependent methyltransferase [Paenibacillus sp. J5C2022]
MPNHKWTLTLKPEEDVFTWLEPQPGERILDLGCGQGSFLARMAEAGAIPHGIDLSEEMVSRARAKYPEWDIVVADASQFRTDQPFDAVFSHASLHWMKEAEAVVQSIRLALRAGGRFVAEFAGSENTAIIINAIRQTLKSNGYAWEGRNPWYHPTLSEYTNLLEQNGFRVLAARHFDSPSPHRGDSWLRNWLSSFDHFFFHDVPQADKEQMYNTIETMLKPQLESDGIWTADTCRIRIAAMLEEEGMQPI